MCLRRVEPVADPRSMNEMLRPGEELEVPLRGISFWELYLPWAFLNVLQTLPKIKRQADACIQHAGRGRACVC